MRKLDLRRIRTLSLAEILSVILLIVALNWLSGLSILLLLPLTVLLVWVIFGIIYHKIRDYDKALCKSTSESRQRLLLLRGLIDHAFTYGSDPELFYAKFCRAVSVDKIKEVAAVDFIPIKGLSPSQMDMYSLLEAGFTSRELCVILNFNHPNSIYVKRSRLRMRIEKHGLHKKDRTVFLKRKLSERQAPFV